MAVKQCHCVKFSHYLLRGILTAGRYDLRPASARRRYAVRILHAIPAAAFQLMASRGTLLKRLRFAEITNFLSVALFVNLGLPDPFLLLTFPSLFHRLHHLLTVECDTPNFRPTNLQLFPHRSIPTAIPFTNSDCDIFASKFSQKELLDSDKRSNLKCINYAKDIDNGQLLYISMTNLMHRHPGQCSMK